MGMVTTKEVFKKIRANEKMTQTELGNSIGLKQAAISFYEKGGEMGYSKLVESLALLGYSLELVKLKK